MEDEETLNIRANMVDESGRSPDVAPESGVTQQSMPINADDVKRVLFGSHKVLIEDILIALLSSENHVKWSNYECSEFYDFALSNTAAIYHAMTIHDLNIVINVLQKMGMCGMSCRNQVEWVKVAESQSTWLHIRPHRHNSAKEN